VYAPAERAETLTLFFRLYPYVYSVDLTDLAVNNDLPRVVSCTLPAFLFPHVLALLAWKIIRYSTVLREGH
jgi:hypothetical protein